MSGNSKVDQGKIKCERICKKKKKSIYKKLFCIEIIFNDFLVLLDFLTKLYLRGERFMSKLLFFFVAYRSELTTDQNKENLSY